MSGLVGGVDEAGRGPVIGPLVVSGVALDNDARLIDIGVKDSKMISREKRERLSRKIAELCKVETLVVPAEELDILRKEMTLNELEVKLFISVIEKLRPNVVYVDSADVDAVRFGEEIKRGLGFKVDVISEHRADRIYPVVSAASIMAKITRDAEVSKIEREMGQEIGSGYPSDPVTVAFLEKWIKEKSDLPPHTRKSWKTSRRILEMARVKKLNEFKR